MMKLKHNTTTGCSNKLTSYIACTSLKINDVFFSTNCNSDMYPYIKESLVTTVLRGVWVALVVPNVRDCGPYTGASDMWLKLALGCVT